MSNPVETVWEVQTILGGGVPPFTNMLDQLVKVFDREGDGIDARAHEQVAAYFAPAEDNPGQHRQAAERREWARRWSMDRLGAVPEWLQLAGVPTEAEPIP